VQRVTLLNHISVLQVRVDCTGYVGYSPNHSFDSLIAKIIVHAPRWSDAVRVLQRALAEVNIAGVSSNVAFLQALVASREFEANDVTTTFIEENMTRFCDPDAPGVQRQRLIVPAAIQPPVNHLQQQQQHQISAASIPLTSPIRGRISRLAVELHGQVAAGACMCAVPLHVQCWNLFASL
jgi:pyruvate carboxylase